MDGMVLGPEEHVRQCLILYLMEECAVPKGLISIEKGLQYHDRKKRFDLMVYDRSAQPLILCECKAPYVPVDQQTAFQFYHYRDFQ